MSDYGSIMQGVLPWLPRWPYGVPPPAFQNRSSRGPRPRVHLRLSLTHPARHVQATLSRSTPCCEPRGWTAAARRGRVPRGAQEAATGEERWGDALLGGRRQKGVVE